MGCLSTLITLAEIIGKFLLPILIIVFVIGTFMAFTGGALLPGYESSPEYTLSSGEAGGEFVCCFGGAFIFFLGVIFWGILRLFR